MCNLVENWRKFEQYGRDALNNTFGECVVAKANEADCFANAEVQSPKGRGDVLFRVHAHKTYVKTENTFLEVIYEKIK